MKTAAQLSEEFSVKSEELRAALSREFREKYADAVGKCYRWKMAYSRKAPSVEALPFVYGRMIGFDDNDNILWETFFYDQFTGECGFNSTHGHVRPHSSLITFEPSLEISASEYETQRELILAMLYHENTGE